MATRLNVGNNIPIWLAFTATHVLVFATWNPTGWDLFHYITMSNAAWSTRALMGCLCLAVLALYLYEVFNSFNMVGAVLFVLTISALLWKAVDWGLVDTHNATLWQWLVPLVIAEFFTLALLSPRIIRWMSGRVPVTGTSHHIDTPVDNQPHH